jgi:hypothetical protein|tara:strand:- start:259 stop:522 length:264 start_codon:yes stop_codon:yes gene_type:complete
MRESTIETKCSRWAKDNGWLGFKFSSPQQRGVPDRLYIKNTQTVYVEFKAPGKHATKYQLHTIEKIRDHGANVYIIDNLEDFINVMS